jgi:hypothetical protein
LSPQGRGGVVLRFAFEGFVDGIVELFAEGGVGVNQ